MIPRPGGSASPMADPLESKVVMTKRRVLVVGRLRHRRSHRQGVR